MKQDIPRLMRESGMTFHLGLPHQAVVEQLERLVALAVAEEREACAVLCDHLGDGDPGHYDPPSSYECVQAIRARSTP